MRATICMSRSLILCHCVNFKPMRYESTSFIGIVADKSHCLKLQLCEFQNDGYESASFNIPVPDKSYRVKLGLRNVIV